MSETAAKAAPPRGAHLACGEQTSSPFVPLRAVRIPPLPNRLRVDHANAGSGARDARESVNPESLRRRAAIGNATHLSLQASLRDAQTDGCRWFDFQRRRCFAGEIPTQPPVPVKPDPQSGLIGLQDGSFDRENGRCGGGLAREGCLRRCPRTLTSAPSLLMESCFAGGSTGQEPRQTLEGNALREAQVDDEGAQVRPERRAGHHRVRRRGLERLRATRAGSAMQRDARHLRHDRGNFDVVIGFTRHLRHAGDGRATVLARRRHHVAPRGRIWMQRPVRAGMRLARALALGPAQQVLPTACVPARAEYSNCPASLVADRAWLRVPQHASSAER